PALLVVYSFPTRRSSDLFRFFPVAVQCCPGYRSKPRKRFPAGSRLGVSRAVASFVGPRHPTTHSLWPLSPSGVHALEQAAPHIPDRKSTRLNSSHRTISY